MRIAILIAGFPPSSIGGVEIASLNLARELAKRGHEVHVITTGDKERRGQQEEDFHIHCIQHAIVPTASPLGAISYSIKALIKMKGINPDIVHAQRFYREGLSAFLAKKFLKKPYCIWCRGADIYLPWTLKNVASRLFLKRANAVIALTQDMKKRIKEICDIDASVIPNGIDLEKFKGLPHRNTSKLATNGQKTILFVGRLHPIKGVAYLIEAMKTIVNKNPKARLLLVGDGGERQNLQNLVKKLDLTKYVDFIGKVGNEKVLEYMATSDVLVLPSLSEGFPVTMLEAMACGLPIVATKIGGIPEIVKNGENGFLVEPQNTREISEKILAFLENDELRGRISQNNVRDVKKYSWKAVVEELEKVYLEAFK